MLSKVYKPTKPKHKGSSIHSPDPNKTKNKNLNLSTSSGSPAKRNNSVLQEETIETDKKLSISYAKHTHVKISSTIIRILDIMLKITDKE